MSNPYFSFKQFTIFHDRCAMKVGVDGVTLGAWADITDAKHILDVGCGSGLITLMLAQRSEAHITALDIDNECVKQTKENVERSPWKDRISVNQISFQDFSERNTKKFDLIVCNPPFFINSLKSPSAPRTTARHTDTLSHSDLILSAKKCLTEEGKLSLILPVPEGELFVETAEKQGLFCIKKTTIFPNFQKPPKRLLLELKKEKTMCETSELTIEKERNTYTTEYEELTTDFYFKRSQYLQRNNLE